MSDLRARARTLLAQAKARSRSHSGRSSFFSIADHLVLPLLWLGATPVLVRFLGIESFGIWMLVNSLMGISGAMGFGLTDSVIKHVSHYRARESEGDVLRVLRFSITMYTVLGAIACVLLVLLAPFLVASAFHLSGGTADVAVAAMRIAGIGVWLRFVDAVLVSAFYGYERFDLAAVGNTLSNVLSVTGALATAVATRNVAAMMWVSVIVLPLTITLRVWMIRRYLLATFRPSPSLDGASFRELYSFGMYSWLQVVGSMLLDHADRLLIASFLGASALGHYAVCNQLSQQVHTLVSRGAAFVFPLASGIIAAGDLPRLRRVYYRGAYFSVLAAVIIAVPLYVMSFQILALWVGEPLARESHRVLEILALVYALSATSAVPFYLLNGAGYVRFNAALGFLNGIVIASAVAVAAPLLGVAGAAMAKLCALPVSVTSRTVLHFRVLRDGRWLRSVALLLPIAATFAIAAVVRHLGYPDGVMSIPNLLLHLAVSSLTAALVAWLTLTAVTRRHLDAA